MTQSPVVQFNPELDLTLERAIDIPKELVWEAWTTPEHVCKWFTPAPWTTKECEIDLRPGGRFRTVMCSPDGQSFDNAGCYLEIVPHERLVWTDALLPGYRPAAEPFMTAIISLQSEGAGTRYTATAIHKDAAGKKQHEDMGFLQGWGTALDQLVAHMKGI